MLPADLSIYSYVLYRVGYVYSQEVLPLKQWLARTGRSSIKYARVQQITVFRVLFVLLIVRLLESSRRS